MQAIDRRNFLKTAGVAAAGVSLAPWAGSATGAAEAAKGCPNAEKLGWPLGCQAYSFNHYTFYEAIEKVQSQLPPIHLQQASSIRAARERGEGVWGPIVTVPEARVRRIPGPNGEISVRVIAPESPLGVYLHFHGGGGRSVRRITATSRICASRRNAGSRW